MYHDQAVSHDLYCAIMVNPLDPTPLYRQLADLLAAKIESGEYRPEQLLPSEPYLMQEYGLARGTVRAAMQLLRERGLIITIQARGSYVVKR
jgi:GntR family transcriptional regulator